MKRFNVVISGVGELGSRHLQGLATCSLPLDIYIQDPSEGALRISEGRWQEVAVSGEIQHRLNVCYELSELPRQIDVVIIASSADARPNIVAEIANLSRVSYWILEKVLARSEAGLQRILHSIGYNGRAWVNTPRRMLTWHQQIKAALAGNLPKKLEVDGGGWGMACNAIHFLDMFAWLTGETLEGLNTDGLDPQWVPAKRPGNFEVMGTLEASFSGGSTVKLTSRPGDVFYAFELIDGDHVWKIDEVAGTASRMDGLSINGRIPYQSEVTGGLVGTLLETCNCELPTLDQSAQMHSVFLSSLLLHWRQHVDTNATQVPIT
jgi:predicted dehydrogenase